MAEPDKQQLSDGHDNYAQAANQTAKAAKQASEFAAKKGAEAAAKGAEAGTKAAAAAVQAGTETGAAVSEVAAGTAAGSPWGAIIVAAWASRKTLFKILVCICLLLLFLIVLIVSLPSIIFGDTGGTAAPSESDATSLTELYNDLANDVAAVVRQGYDSTFAKIEAIIEENGFDYDLCMEKLINHAQSSAGFDVAYILAAYSASMGQHDTSREDMLEKLAAVADRMFPFSYTEYEEEIPADPEVEGSEPSTVRYAEFTISAFDSSVINEAFGIDPDAPYYEFGITYGEAIEKMANALKMTLYGDLGEGSAVPLTDAELVAFVENLDCSEVRKHLMETALSLVGKVPYFWGGKSGPGWNSEWNTPKLVTAAGSSTTGTIRPYGLDCSGFTQWTYNTALGVDIGAGTYGQMGGSTTISASELLPGDLAFLAGDDGGWDHVLLFAGYDESGARLFCHCTSGSGVIVNTPSYADRLVYARPNGVDFDAPLSYYGE